MRVVLPVPLVPLQGLLGNLIKRGDVEKRSIFYFFLLFFELVYRALYSEMQLHVSSLTSRFERGLLKCRIVI